MITLRKTPPSLFKSILPGAIRTIAMASIGAAPIKREGDISDAFASLAGQKEEPLPDRFRELKLSLIAGREREVEMSWKRLLGALRAENSFIVKNKSAIIPEVHFTSIESDLHKLRDEIQKRGAVVVRGVVPEDEARAYKTELEEYIGKNPHTRGYPAHDRQVFELYWSAPQIRARGHPNLLHAQRTLNQLLWQVNENRQHQVDLSIPLSYADRLRIRQPGDTSFALGPHQDGGSVERWERNGYGLGGVYDAVFAGEWDGVVGGGDNKRPSFSPWDAGARVNADQNLYNGLGACSMLRTFQGWLSMSHSGPDEGILQVYPGLKLATAYTLLRPFFRPIKPYDSFGKDGVESNGFLSPENWVLTRGSEMTSDLHGATPGRGQEFPRPELHPHLELAKTMVHVPKVKPGDFVVWHCDTIHAVDRKHNGTTDSSVLYIPVCPLTEANARYLAIQRQAFLNGTPGPDFPGGKGEADHVGRPTEEYAREQLGSLGLQALGLEGLPVTNKTTRGARVVAQRANEALGF